MCSFFKHIHWSIIELNKESSIVVKIVKTKSHVKGEPRPEIFLLDMKVLTLIKAKSNDFL